jgi:preprotein translocase subunit SecG
MQTIILVIHLLLAIALVGAVLLQKSEGGLGGLGGSGPGGGGMGGLLDGRATANFLTRATGVLAGSFFITSIGLAILAGGDNSSSSVIQTVTTPVESVPLEPKTPAVPTGQ